MKPKFRNRLMAIGIYLTAITDYLLYQEEYEKRDVYLRKNSTLLDDFSILEEKMDPIMTVPEVALYLKLSKAKGNYSSQRDKIPNLRCHGTSNSGTSPYWLSSHKNNSDHFLPSWHTLCTE